jgi:putative PIN family toxin of toxin-antitoxin system
MTMRVVYDTNVVVSAVLKPASIPAVLLSLALVQRVRLCVSPPILAEYTAVLHRPKFGFEASSIATLLEDLTRTALLVHPTMNLTVATDEADNRFLECAVEASAAFLVTGNLRHFPVATFEDIQIVEPARFAHVLVERLRS